MGFRSFILKTRVIIGSQSYIDRDCRVLCSPIIPVWNNAMHKYYYIWIIDTIRYHRYKAYTCVDMNLWWTELFESKRHFYHMMTPLNGNFFRVTHLLFGEFTGHQWIPLIKACDAELWCFFDLRLNKHLSKQLIRWWFETLLRLLWRHCNYILWKCQQQNTMTTTTISYVRDGKRELPFCRSNFQMCFLERKLVCFDSNFANFCSMWSD